MKQMWSTGWAHNRLRVVAASFAVKNLLLPWQWGLKHFWDAQVCVYEGRCDFLCGLYAMLGFDHGCAFAEHTGT